MWNLVVVLAENKPGKLASITNALGKNNIDILMFDVDDEGKYGIVHILTANPEKARNVLMKENISAALSPAAMVEMPDTPGALGSLMSTLAEESINVTKAMGCILEKGEKAAFIIKSELEPGEIEDKLAKRGIKVLEEI